MSWVNNLDEELKIQKKIRKRNGSKTVCKPVSLSQANTKSSNKVKTTKSKILVTQKSIITSNTTTKKLDDDEEKKEKDPVKSAIALFSSRVTMAGVEDAYKAKTKWERWMWYLTLMTTLPMAIYTASGIAKKYFHPQIVYDYYPIALYQPPFPNVSLCAPFLINKTKFIQYLLIPNRTRNLIKRKQMDLEEIIDYTLEFWRFDQYPRTVNSKNQLVSQASFEIMKETESQFINGYAELIMRTTPKCEEVLSDCSFHGTRFDCCQAAQQIWTFDVTCFQINVNQIPEFSNTTFAPGGEADDPIKLEVSGLVVNASFDWEMASYFEETARDGFQLVLGRLMSMSENPTSIPSGADALVTIGTTKMDELSNCRPNNNLPKMKLFDHYDPYGTLIFFEQSFLVSLGWTGCDMPYLTHYLHENRSSIPACPIELAAFTKLWTGMVEQMQFADGMNLKAFDINQFGLDMFHNSLPLCNRWEYHIATASYGYVHYRDQTEWDRPRKDEGKAWSRIRIFFPSSSYLHRIEQPPNPAYVAMCDVGGSMGFYIGVSIISFVQIFVYGVFVFYSMFAKHCKRKNRVEPA